MPINYADYPPNWKTEIRPAVLARAGNKCEQCGVPNHALIYRPFKGLPHWKQVPEGTEADVLALEGHKCTKIVLTIAHLDHDKFNHDIDISRLRAWCQRCHLQYDLPWHIKNRKYGRNDKTGTLEL